MRLHVLMAQSSLREGQRNYSHHDPFRNENNDTQIGGLHDKRERKHC